MESSYFCKLCSSELTAQEVIEHLTGLEHRLKYFVSHLHSMLSLISHLFNASARFFLHASVKQRMNDNIFYTLVRFFLN